MRSTNWILALAVLLFIGVQGGLAGPILLGTTGNGSTPSTLVELDPLTGDLVRTIGSVGYTVNGMVWDPVTGKLYAGTGANDPNYNGLIEIDMTTGAGTPIGAANWGSANPQAVTAITLDATGRMFGWCEYCYDSDSLYFDELNAVDRSTGVNSRVGNPGIGTSRVGFTRDSTGALILVNGGGDYYSVDSSTGQVTYLGDIYSTAHHGVFSPANNLYYGIDDAGIGPKNIVIADLSNQTIVSLLPTVNNLHTLAFVGDASVPEPGTVLSLGLGLAAMAVIRLRRR